MAKCSVDSKFYEELLLHLETEQKVALGGGDDGYTPEDIQTMEEICEGVFQYIAETLNENKSETEAFELEIPAAGTFKVSYREGSEGNWGVGFTAGAAFKKRIKGDAEAEDILDDEE